MLADTHDHQDGSLMSRAKGVSLILGYRAGGYRKERVWIRDR